MIPVIGPILGMLAEFDSSNRTKGGLDFPPHRNRFPARCPARAGRNDPTRLEVVLSRTRSHASGNRCVPSSLRGRAKPTGLRDQDGE